jgi:hypothetical protein
MLCVTWHPLPPLCKPLPPPALLGAKFSVVKTLDVMFASFDSQMRYLEIEKAQLAIQKDRITEITKILEISKSMDRPELTSALNDLAVSVARGTSRLDYSNNVDATLERDEIEERFKRFLEVRCVIGVGQVVGVQAMLDAVRDDVDVNMSATFLTKLMRAYGFIKHRGCIKNVNIWRYRGVSLK